VERRRLREQRRPAGDRDLRAGLIFVHELSVSRLGLEAAHEQVEPELDEPTTGLDPEVRALMWEEIARLAGDEGLTILLTTHYLEEADRLARQLAIVDRGRVVAEGSPEGLKGELRGDAIRVELGDPETNGRVHAALARVPAVRELVLDGRELHARADNGATAVPAVLAALEAAGVPVAAATVSRPSLDDVYLRYAGRSFSAADADTKEESR
jgi:ABC-2 type transport system ATP-binding protein